MWNDEVVPYRKSPIVTNEIYHVFNRSVARQPIFFNQNDYQRALELVNFYRFDHPPLRFSHYKRLPPDQKETFFGSLLKNNRQIIEILAFCIMPNHVHFLLKQKVENGIPTFMRNFQNSYAKYFNTKADRSGSLLQSMFKAVRIETDEQLIHVSRYVHLNPVTAYIIEIDQLEHYAWSSFKDYILMNRSNSFVSIDFILSFFPLRDEFKKFVYDQVGYQRELDKIKHLVFE